MSEAAVPKGYVVEKAGQVRAGNQLWLRHESRIPTFGVSASELFKELLRFFQFGSALSSSFTAIPEKQLVRVYCAVLYPRDASVSEIDDRTRKQARFSELLSSAWILVGGDFAGSL